MSVQAQNYPVCTLEDCAFEPSLNSKIKSAQPLVTTLPNFNDIETTDQQTASRTPANDTQHQLTIPLHQPTIPLHQHLHLILQSDSMSLFLSHFHIQAPEKIFIHTIQTFLILFNVAGSRLKQTLLRCS